MADNPVRVLVVDDTVVYRKIVSDVLADDPEIEVVGTAANGKIAIQKLDQLQPDVLTLDLEMPEMNGLEVLQHLKDRKNPPGAIMISAFTAQGAQTTLKALNEGAFDFILKPSADSLDENKTILKKQLCPKINAYARTRQVKDILTSQSVAIHQTPPKKPADSTPVKTNITGFHITSKPKIIVLGISTGGPKSLVQMIPQLPANLNVPLLIVQHMPPIFTKSLADDLNKRCDWTVSEGQDGQPVLPGHIIIAPGGKQMKIKREQDLTKIVITDDPPENNCKPAVDYLFRSVANEYGAKTLGVIMTGMGSDGTLGCRLLKRLGASIIAQDEASCVVFGMPKQIVEEGIADVVCPLDRIADQIGRIVHGGMALCR